MLNYIKEKLLGAAKEKEALNDSIITEGVVEYAKVFQELDDLSMAGTDAGKARPMSAIDIPVDDDIELSTIEFNISDGRVTDVPTDATTQEAAINENMKTFDDFVQEAALTTKQLPRESDDSFADRKHNKATKMYAEYSANIVQEGLFGNDKIRLDDDRVPGSAKLDFGPIDPKEPDKHLFVSLGILWSLDRKERVLMKQLDAINYFVTNNVASRFADVLTENFTKKYGEKFEGKNLWDIARPTKLIAPIDPMDSWVVVLVIECDFSDKDLYYTWTRPLKRVGGTKNAIEDTKGITETTANKVPSGSDVKRKNQFVGESYKHIPNRFKNSFYQEAIDFGSAVPDGGSPNDIPPEPVVSDKTDNVDGVATTDTSTTNAEPEIVKTNDVSGEIAKNVSDKTGGDEASTEGTESGLDDLNTGLSTEDDNTNEHIDGKDDSTESSEPTIDDTNTSDDDDSIDKHLNDLDDMSTDGSLSDNVDDVKNMTIDELLKNGSEKLKGMTVEELQNFINTGSMAAVQEAFFLTAKNINKEIETHLKTALGILNNSEMTLDELFINFKKEGKQLNRVLSKAAKMKKVYTDEEVESFNKLNKALTDLMVILTDTRDQSYALTVKRLIQAFTSQSAVVAKIVESKTSKTVQEAVNDIDIDRIFTEYKIDDKGEIAYNTFERILIKLGLSGGLIGAIFVGIFIPGIVFDIIAAKILLMFTSLLFGTTGAVIVFSEVDSGITKKNIKLILKNSLNYATPIIQESDQMSEELWENTFNVFYAIKNASSMVNVLGSIFCTECTDVIKQFGKMSPDWFGEDYDPDDPDMPKILANTDYAKERDILVGMLKDLSSKLEKPEADDEQQYSISKKK